jgi:hypothetical protein
VRGCIIGYWIWGRRVGRVGISLWSVGLGIEGGGGGREDLKEEAEVEERMG